MIMKPRPAYVVVGGIAYGVATIDAAFHGGYVREFVIPDAPPEIGRAHV